MPDLSISALPAAGAITGAELIPIVQGGIAKQVGLTALIASKQNTLTTGTQLQYFRGDLSLATFPTALSEFSNDLGFITGVDWGSIGGTLVNQTDLMLELLAKAPDILTGYLSGAGTVAPTDSVLQAIEKLDGNIGAIVSGVSSVNALTGAVALTGTANRLTVSNANVFDISTNYVGQTSIVTLGTIGTGAWQGTSISATYTDAKIKGTVLAVAGQIPRGTGTLDTITSTSDLSFVAGINISGGLKVTNGASYISLDEFNNQYSGSALWILPTGVAKTATNFTIGAQSDYFVTLNSRNSGGDGGFRFQINYGVNLVMITNTAFRTNATVFSIFGDATIAATARVHIVAGTAAAGRAPLKLVTSGTGIVGLLTTPEKGAMEFSDDGLHFTKATTRESVMLATSVNAVSPTSPNRTIQLDIGGTTYYIAAKTTND